MNEQASALRKAAMVVALTMVLGGTVAISWLVFAGTEAWNGPIRTIQEDWPLIYGSQAFFVAIVGYIAAPFLGKAFGRPGAVLAIVAAWIGEFFALLFGGRLLAGELGPEMSRAYWIIGTAGPLQPLAALVGASVTSRRRPPTQPRMA